MEYSGKLYGKVGNRYFFTGKTSTDYDNLIKRNKEANEFIKDIAELLGMDSDGLGFDELQLSIDDFKDAIEIIKQ